MKPLTGFTLIELLITLVLGALILSLGVPAYQGLVERGELTTNINKFVSSLALARSEAVKRKQFVIICPSTDGADCTAGGNYESGWIVYVETDTPPDNSRDPNNEELLWVNEQLPNAITLRPNTTTLDVIRFASSGRSNGSGSIKLCKDGQINKARMLTLITSGRVHLAKNNPAGIPLDSSGNPITNC